MVRLVVDHQDVLHAHQVWHHPLQHLTFVFLGLQFVAGTALQQLAPALGYFEAFAQLEGVEVGDDDLGPMQLVEHVARHQFAVLVIAVGVVGLQYPQAVLDGQAGSTDQETAREILARRSAHRIDRLPGNQHRHHRRLARTGGELQRQAHQFRVGVLVRRRQVFKDAFAVFGLGRHLGEPDRGFHRFYLTEEGTDFVERVMPPMLEQASRLRRDLPLPRIGQGAPRVHVTTHLVDDGRRVVLLFLRRQPLAVVENKGLLRALGSAVALLGFWDRCDELCAAPRFQNRLRRLSILVKLPML